MAEKRSLPVPYTGVKTDGAAKAIKKSEANTPVKKAVREYKKQVADITEAEMRAEAAEQTVFVEVGDYDQPSDGLYIGDDNSEILIPWDELEGVIEDLTAELDEYETYLNLKEEDAKDADGDSTTHSGDAPPVSADADRDGAADGEAPATEGRR